MATKKAHVPTPGTLAWRLNWLVNNGHDESGRSWSMRGLSAAAGLSPSHVEQIIKERQQKTEEETLAKISAVSGCSLPWLAKGEGSAFGGTPVPPSATPVSAVAPPPDRLQVQRTDQYEHRAEALVFMTGLAPEQVLKSVAMMKLAANEDPSFEQWCEIIKDRSRMWKRLEQGLKRNDVIPLDE